MHGASVLQHRLTPKLLCPLQAVVSEFAPSTATPLGLPWDFHERCRAALEAGYLQTFYSHAQRLAGEAASAAVQGRDGGSCVACIRLMNTILGWDFRWELRGLHEPNACWELVAPLGWEPWDAQKTASTRRALAQGGGNACVSGLSASCVVACIHLMSTTAS